AFEIYLTGCGREPKCSNCHNPELWDFNKGEEIDYNKLKNDLSLKLNQFDNIVILGGEPLDQDILDLIELLSFLIKFKKPIWLYTSYELEDIPKDVLKLVDYVKVGRYDESQKGNFTHYGVTLHSANQKIYPIDWRYTYEN